MAAESWSVNLTLTERVVPVLPDDEEDRKAVDMGAKVRLADSKVPRVSEKADEHGRPSSRGSGMSMRTPSSPGMAMLARSFSHVRSSPTVDSTDEVDADPVEEEDSEDDTTGKTRKSARRILSGKSAIGWDVARRTVPTQHVTFPLREPLTLERLKEAAKQKFNNLRIDHTRFLPPEPMLMHYAASRKAAEGRATRRRLAEKRAADAEESSPRPKTPGDLISDSVSTSGAEGGAGGGGSAAHGVSAGRPTEVGGKGMPDPLSFEVVDEEHMADIAATWKLLNVDERLMLYSELLRKWSTPETGAFAVTSHATAQLRAAVCAWEVAVAPRFQQCFDVNIVSELAKLMHHGAHRETRVAATCSLAALACGSGIELLSHPSVKLIKNIASAARVVLSARATQDAARPDVEWQPPPVKQNEALAVLVAAMASHPAGLSAVLAPPAAKFACPMLASTSPVAVGASAAALCVMVAHKPSAVARILVDAGGMPLVARLVEEGTPHDRRCAGSILCSFASNVKARELLVPKEEQPTMKNLPRPAAVYSGATVFDILFALQHWCLHLRGGVGLTAAESAFLDGDGGVAFDQLRAHVAYSLWAFASISPPDLAESAGDRGLIRAQMLVAMLDSDLREVIGGSLGVLANSCRTTAACASVVRAGAVGPLVASLREFDATDRLTECTLSVINALSAFGDDDVLDELLRAQCIGVTLATGRALRPDIGASAPQSGILASNAVAHMATVEYCSFSDEELDGLVDYLGWLDPKAVCSSAMFVWAAARQEGARRRLLDRGALTLLSEWATLLTILLRGDGAPALDDINCSLLCRAPPEKEPSRANHSMVFADEGDITEEVRPSPSSHESDAQRNGASTRDGGDDDEELTGVQSAGAGEVINPSEPSGEDISSENGDDDSGSTAPAASVTGEHTGDAADSKTANDNQSANSESGTSTAAGPSPLRTEVLSKLQSLFECADVAPVAALEYIMTALWVSIYDERAPHMFAAEGGIELITTILQFEDSEFHSVLYMAAATTWLVGRSGSDKLERLVRCGAIERLIRVAQNDKQPVKTKIMAADAVQDLARCARGAAEHPDGTAQAVEVHQRVLQQLTADGRTHGVLNMLVDFLRNPEDSAQRYGAKYIARVANTSKAKHAIAELDGCRVLCQLLKKSCVRSVLLDAMGALLNLTTESECQLQSGRHGAGVLLHFARAVGEPKLAEFATHIIRHVKRHDKNVSMLYRAELHFKSSDWHVAFQDDSSDASTRETRAARGRERPREAVGHRRRGSDPEASRSKATDGGARAKHAQPAEEQVDSPTPDDTGKTRSAVVNEMFLEWAESQGVMAVPENKRLKPVTVVIDQPSKEQAEKAAELEQDVVYQTLHDSMLEEKEEEAEAKRSMLPSRSGPRKVALGRSSRKLGGSPSKRGGALLGLTKPRGRGGRLVSSTPFLVSKPAPRVAKPPPMPAYLATFSIPTVQDVILDKTGARGLRRARTAQHDSVLRSHTRGSIVRQSTASTVKSVVSREGLLPHALRQPLDRTWSHATYTGEEPTTSHLHRASSAPSFAHRSQTAPARASRVIDEGDDVEQGLTFMTEVPRDSEPQLPEVPEVYKRWLPVVSKYQRPGTREELPFVEAIDIGAHSRANRLRLKKLHRSGVADESTSDRRASVELKALEASSSRVAPPPTTVVLSPRCPRRVVTFDKPFVDDDVDEGEVEMGVATAPASPTTRRRASVGRPPTRPGTVPQPLSPLADAREAGKLPSEAIAAGGSAGLAQRSSAEVQGHSIASRGVAALAGAADPRLIGSHASHSASIGFGVGPSASASGAVHGAVHATVDRDDGGDSHSANGENPSKGESVNRKQISAALSQLTARAAEVPADLGMEGKPWMKAKLSQSKLRPTKADLPGQWRRATLASRKEAANALHIEAPPPVSKFVGAPGVSMCKFDHVAGSEICRGLFRHYQMPDGRLVHYYVDDVLNEVVSSAEFSVPEPPLELQQVKQLLEAPPAVQPTSSEVPSPYVPGPPAPPPVFTHVLQSDFPVELHFLIVEACPLEITEYPDPAALDLNTSVWRPRKAESESKAFYTKRAVQRRMFTLDWFRIATKDRFVRYLMRETGEDDAVIDRVKRVCLNSWGLVVSAFDFYCAMGHRDAFSMQSNSVDEFATDCMIVDEETCRRRDISTMFVAVNVEDNRNSEEGKNNQDRSLCRHEFLELLIRVAVVKYLRTKECDTMKEAMESLLTFNVGMSLEGTPAAHDPDKWRKARLYTTDVNDVLKHHRPLIRTIFAHYVSNIPGTHRKSRYMSLGEWMYFVQDAKLLNETLTKREVITCFVWARMRVSDELTKRERVVNCTFTDFMEALCRLAEIVSLPTEWDLSQLGVADAATYFTRAVEQGRELERRPSTEWGYPYEERRPLSEKLHEMLELVHARLKDEDWWTSGGR